MKSIAKFVYIRIFFLFKSTKTLFYLKNILGDEKFLYELSDWKLRNFDIPTPQIIKNIIFLQYTSDNRAWIETGTYRGLSTKFLAKNSKHVYTIEPEVGFHNETKTKLTEQGYKNISYYLGTSEESLDLVLNEVKEKEACFWLDGHYSGSGTYQGEKECPIIEELQIIEKNLTKFDKVTILIDDIREFNTFNQNYPNKEFLIEWANQNQFNWEIKFDMMIIDK